jgi:hypothetical protein
LPPVVPAALNFIDSPAHHLTGSSRSAPPDLPNRICHPRINRPIHAPLVRVIRAGPVHHFRSERSHALRAPPDPSDGPRPRRSLYAPVVYYGYSNPKAATFACGTANVLLCASFMINAAI